MSGKMYGKTGSYATSTDVYDASGNLIGVDYTTAGAAPKSGTSRKIFIVDAQGNILLAREQSWNSPTVEQRQILMGDELALRYSTNSGSFGDLQDEQKKAFWEAYNADAYQSMVTPGGTLTVEAGANPTTGQVVVVREGDTLQSIAQRVYGTAEAWYRLADANRLEHGSVLVAGTSLVVPSGKRTVSPSAGKGAALANDRDCSVSMFDAVQMHHQLVSCLLQCRPLTQPQDSLNAPRPSVRVKNAHFPQGSPFFPGQF